MYKDNQLLLNTPGQVNYFDTKYNIDTSSTTMITTHLPWWVLLDIWVTFWHRNVKSILQDSQSIRRTRSRSTSVPTFVVKSFDMMKIPFHVSFLHFWLRCRHVHHWYRYTSASKLWHLQFSRIPSVLFLLGGFRIQILYSYVFESIPKSFCHVTIVDLVTCHRTPPVRYSALW